MKDYKQNVNSQIIFIVCNLKCIYNNTKSYIVNIISGNLKI